MYKPFAFVLTSALGAFLFGGCMDDPEGASEPAVAAETTFLDRARGTWLYDFRIDGQGSSVFVRDTVEIGPNRHDVRADVYADEARTTKLFHLEWTATMAVVGRGSVPDAFDVDIRLTSAKLTSFVDDPALWAALGVDDCELVPNQPVDVMATNCLFPLTRNTTCTERELYAIAPGSNELRVGTPEADPCAKRPATIDPQRAPYVRR